MWLINPSHRDCDYAIIQPRTCTEAARDSTVHSGKPATTMAAPAPQSSPTNNSPVTLQRTRKRTAQDALLATPAKRLRFLEPSSINGILQQHAQKRLYVHPLQWTSDHLHFLGCEFVSGFKLASSSKSNNPVVDENLVQHVTLTTGFLEPRCPTASKAIAIQDMLVEHGLYKAW